MALRRINKVRFPARSVLGAPLSAPLNRPRPEPALARKGAKARGTTLDGTLSLCPPLETHGNARGTAGAC